MNRHFFIEQTLANNPIVPVMVIDRVEDAVPLAEALMAGGIQIMEITLRTEAALDAMGQIVRHVPDAVVGAGTILTPEHLRQTIDAGARFGVSPGVSESLIQAIDDAGFPFLPGAATPSEMISLLERGYAHQKFFPAEAAGGIPMLSSLASPLPMINFCPTGGISATNAGDYLALKNVVSVGGSWVAPNTLVENKDWAGITRLSKQALAAIAK
jgi:2-dehydro-3-deoxyphosphogluconate aldolase / (4S)-4-hydroxy-2-oxoglutarate aldolase